MQERTSLEDSLSGIGKVERELSDNVDMIELGEAEHDTGVVAEAEAALKALKKEVARRELEALKLDGRGVGVPVPSNVIFMLSAPAREAIRLATANATP